MVDVVIFHVSKEINELDLDVYGYEPANAIEAMAFITYIAEEMYKHAMMQGEKKYGSNYIEIVRYITRLGLRNWFFRLQDLARRKVYLLPLYENTYAYERENHDLSEPIVDMFVDAGSPFRNIYLVRKEEGINVTRFIIHVISVYAEIHAIIVAQFSSSFPYENEWPDIGRKASDQQYIYFDLMPWLQPTVKTARFYDTFTPRQPIPTPTREELLKRVKQPPPILTLTPNIA